MRAHFNFSLTTIVHLPTVNGVQIDLYLLYNKVQMLGGYQSVVSRKKWKEVAESIGLIGKSLGIDNYLRQIYNRYLIGLENRDPWNADDSYDLENRREVDLFFTLPTTYNYNFLYIDNAQRKEIGLAEATNLINPSFHLELSLLSGVSSSVDFAINCCLLMTSEVPLPRIDLTKCKRLFDIILSWLGFNQDRSYDLVFSRHWNSHRFVSFPEFWRLTTDDYETVKCLAVNGLWDEQRVECINSSVRKRQETFTNKILKILNNSMFDDWNLSLIGKHDNALRLLLLASFNGSKTLKMIALSALEIASFRVHFGENLSKCVPFGFKLLLLQCLDPQNIKNRQLSVIIKGIQILSGLCNSPQNKDFIEDLLTISFMQSICEIFIENRTNIAVILNGLEFFHNLNRISPKIAEILIKVEDFLVVLVEFLRIDRSKLALFDFEQVKFGEHKVRFVTYDNPLPQNIPQKREFPVNMSGGVTLDTETVEMTRTWLMNTCQVVENSKTVVSSLFGSYRKFCEKIEFIGVPHHLFALFVWSVFPQVKLVGGTCFYGLQHREEKNQVLTVKSPELMDSLLTEKINKNKYSIKRITNPPIEEVNGLCDGESHSFLSENPPKRSQVYVPYSPVKDGNSETEGSSVGVKTTIKPGEMDSDIGSESGSVDIITHVGSYFSEEGKDLLLECSWDKCRRRFGSSSARVNHVITAHINELSDSGGCCPWNECGLTSYKKWSLVSHILEKHIPELSSSTPMTEVQFTDSSDGLEMSRRHSFEHVDFNKEFTCESEDALVKHIRMISGQIILNWCKVTTEAVRMMRRYESILSDMMFSGCDCKKILADCLCLIQQDECE